MESSGPVDAGGIASPFDPRSQQVVTQEHLVACLAEQKYEIMNQFSAVQSQQHRERMEEITKLAHTVNNHISANAGDISNARSENRWFVVYAAAASAVVVLGLLWAVGALNFDHWVGGQSVGKDIGRIESEMSRNFATIEAFRKDTETKFEEILKRLDQKQ